jgi:hypothetical protein
MARVEVLQELKLAIAYADERDAKATNRFWTPRMIDNAILV